MTEQTIESFNGGIRDVFDFLLDQLVEEKLDVSLTTK